jgi:hypothetical protein
MRKILIMLTTIVIAISLNIFIYAEAGENADSSENSMYEEMDDSNGAYIDEYGIFWPAEGIIVPNYSAMNFDEAAAIGIPYGIPNEQVRDNAIAKGYIIENNIAYPKEKDSAMGISGYMLPVSSVEVYSAAGGGDFVGIVEYKQAVYITDIAGEYARIQFEKINHETAVGYVLLEYIHGKEFFKDVTVTTNTIIDTENKIDITGEHGMTAPIYAEFDGIVTPKVTTILTTEGKTLNAHRGWHIDLKSNLDSYSIEYNNLRAIVGVGSTFAPSTGASYFGVKFTTNIYPTREVTKNSHIGYVGSTNKH